MSHKHILLFFEAAAMLTCFLHFSKLRKTGFRIFFLLLPLVNAVEWGNYFYLFSINRSNNWVFNLVVHPVEFACYAWLYYQYLKKWQTKELLFVLYLVLLLLMAVDLGFIQGMRYLNTYTYIIGCCFMVYCASLYFRQVIYSAGAIKIVSTLHYWLSMGVLFFFSGEAILFSFFQYFLAINNFGPFIPVFLFFSNLLNIILYTCLSISFICHRKPQNILS